MTGVAVKTLQTALPDACVLYSSATGASGMCPFEHCRHMCARSPHSPPRCAQEPVNAHLFGRRSSQASFACATICSFLVLAVMSEADVSTVSG